MCGVCGCQQLIPLAAAERRLANTARVAFSPESDVADALAVERSLLDHNRAHAESLAKRLAERGIEAIGILGGPGAGKTALLEATFEHLGREDAAREAVVEGDCATDFDARRVAAKGARVAQVATGSLCHLDAHLVEHALEANRSVRCRPPVDRERRQSGVPGALSLRRAAPRRADLGGRGRRQAREVPRDVRGRRPAGDLEGRPASRTWTSTSRAASPVRGARIPDCPLCVLSARNGTGLDSWLAWVHGEGA